MHDIAHELTIGASRDEVFDAITTEEGLAGWWTTDCTARPAEGSEATFGFEGHSIVMTMRVDTMEKPELVHWQCSGGPDEWVGTQIAFRIEPSPDTDGASVVRFWHGGWEYEDGLLPSCSFQWAMYLASLRSLLETGTGAPNTS